MSNEKLTEYGKTFCILPFTHAATYTDGSVILCCLARNIGNLNLNKQSWPEIWNSQHFRDARKAVLNGQQYPACQRCYNEEAIGVTSHRQIENWIAARDYGEEYIKDLIESTGDDGTLTKNLIAVDFRLGNTCNLQCVMCRPQDSSKWLNDSRILAKELKSDTKWEWRDKSNIKTSDFEWYKRPEFWESFFESADNIRHMILAGGEPMYIKEHRHLLDELIKRGFSKNISIRYHTNGTIYNQEVVELWKHFKNIELMISLDGHEWVNSYIRYPANWEEIEENLEKYDNTPDNISVKISCTVQALNIFWLPEFCEWILNKNYKKVAKIHGGIFHPSLLHGPYYLSAKVLSPEQKQIVTEKLDNFISNHPRNKSIQLLKGMVEFMNSEDHSKFYSQTIEYLEKLDSLHGTYYKPLLDIR